MYVRDTKLMAAITLRVPRSYPGEHLKLAFNICQLAVDYAATILLYFRPLPRSGTKKAYLVKFGHFDIKKDRICVKLLSAFFWIEPSNLFVK